MERAEFVLQTVLVLESAFWLPTIAFHLISALDLLPQFRIQPAGSLPSRGRIAAAAAETLVNGLLVRPLVLYGAFPYLGERLRGAGEVPGAGTVALQLMGCMLVDDTWFYWAHRAVHAWPWLYAAVHKKHHAFHHPVAAATLWAHPLEDLLVNTAATAAGPALLGCHLRVAWAYFALKVWQSVDAHSGYNLPFPLSPFSAVPGMDCAPAHDFHHRANVGCYGGFFSFWDWAMGTDARYRAMLAGPEGAARAYRSVKWRRRA